jgi:hypothetical protein
MSEIGGTTNQRREFLKKAAIAGGVAWTAPIIIEGVISPASAASVFASLSFTVQSNGTSIVQDGTSASIPAGTGCTLTGYQSGQPTTFTGSGSATKSNSVAETATLTISNLPSAGTCTLTGIAQCIGPSGSVCSSTASATKAEGSTNSTALTFSLECGSNNLLKIFVAVSC